MIEKISLGLLTMDEYSINPKDDELPYPECFTDNRPWRRPDNYDLTRAFQRNLGSLTNASFRLANELKALYIFEPKIFSYPWWLINNPNLLYLSSLPLNNPNNIKPLFNEPFFDIYHYERENINCYDIFKKHYPVRKDPTLKNESWIGYQYYNYEHFFESTLRSPLENYMSNYLNKLNGFPKKTVDPAKFMRDIGKSILLEGDPFKFASHIFEESEIVKKIYIKSLQKFLDDGNLLTMTNLFPFWRQIAKKEGYKYTPYQQTTEQMDLIDWLYLDTLYIPGHSNAVNEIPVGYNSRSMDVGCLKTLNSDMISFKNEPNININGKQYDIEFGEGKIKSIDQYLSTISFEDIFKEIRQKDFYLEYMKAMTSARIIPYPELSITKSIDAVNDLLDNIIPILGKLTKNPFFKEGIHWKLSKFNLISKNNYIALIGIFTSTAGIIYSQYLSFLGIAIEIIPLINYAIDKQIQKPIKKDKDNCRIAIAKFRYK